MRRSDEEVVVGCVEHVDHPALNDEPAHRGIPRTFPLNFKGIPKTAGRGGAPGT